MAEEGKPEKKERNGNSKGKSEPVSTTQPSAAPAPEQQAKPVDEAAELKDRLLRLAAEFDNYKKRTAKEVDNAKSLGKAELVKRLLPTLDEFELALAALDKADKHAKGIEMVYSNFLDALKSAGLEEIMAKGKVDPYKHEAIMTREDTAADGTILEVVRKGYTLNGIMLRPASVIVSKGGKNENKK